MKKTELNTNDFRITGTKTLKGLIETDNLKANLFDGVELANLMTTNSAQELTEPLTLTKPAVFTSIQESGNHPYGTVDGVDLFSYFRSDLQAILDSEAWQDDTLAGNFIFHEIAIEHAAELKVNDKVNGMDVDTTLARMVQDVASDSEVNIDGKALCFQMERMQDLL